MPEGAEWSCSPRAIQTKNRERDWRKDFENLRQGLFRVFGGRRGRPICQESMVTPWVLVIVLVIVPVGGLIGVRIFPPVTNRSVYADNLLWGDTI